MMDSDHRDLLTALKLLSGKECLRDAQQAHTMLVGLTGSQHDTLARDAQAVLSAGMARDWFGEKIPHYFELERIAEQSLAEAAKNPAHARYAVKIGIALLLLLAGLLAFFLQSQ